jgi:hypothetical protein
LEDGFGADDDAALETEPETCGESEAWESVEFL